MKIFFSAALFLVAVSVYAQDIQFGAKAGLNVASITGDDTGELKSRTDFHIGAVAEIPISEKFSFQPELLYSGQGARQTVEQINIDIKVNYINLPLIAKYYVSEGFSLEAGPQVGFLVSAKVEDADVKEIFKAIDFGLIFGAGYKLENGLNFAARYNLGLSNIADGEGSDEVTIKNGVFQVSVGYFFL